MHKLTLLILALLLTLPTSGHAQTDAIPIAPCLPANAALIRMEHTSEWGESVRVIRDIAGFYALEGEPIEWLGYGEVGHESDEWYGITAGFKGINMMLYGERFMIMLYGDGKTFAKREIIGRIETHEYNEDYYVMYFTRLTANADNEGRHMGYHIFSANGHPCMFKLTKEDFNQAVGWQ